MGVPATPQDAAPAYEDVFGDHPVNRIPASGSTSDYAAVAQDDDLELGRYTHEHASSYEAPAAQPESLAQAIAGVFKPEPHVHCEQCDVQLAARQRLENKKHCCNMVAATFMISFICAFIFTIVFTAILHRHRR